MVRGVLLGLLYHGFFFLRRKKFDPLGVKRILVIAMYRIGDGMASLPVLRALKEGFPGARLTVFSNAYSRDIYDLVPEVDEVVSHPDTALWHDKALLLRRVSAVPYDLVVDLTSDYRLANVFLSWFAGAGYRAGFNIAGRGFLFHAPVPYPEEKLSMGDILLKLPCAFGLTPSGRRPVLELPAECRQEAAAFLLGQGISENDILVGINPGGQYPTQRWPLERWARVAEGVMSRGLKAVFMGTAQELSRLKGMTACGAVFFENGSVKALLFMTQRLDLLLCNNSGPLHVAAALGTPTVSTMGPAIPEKWWPQGEGHAVLCRDLPCRPCNEGSCRLGTHDCLRQISADEMLSALDAQLSRLGKRRPVPGVGAG
jgi:heptosyltransferase-2/heptosyltransferase-3